MKTVRLTFDHLDFVVGTFQAAGADGIVRMIQDAVFKKSQTTDKLLDRRMLDRTGHAAPVVQHVFDASAVTVVIDHFQLRPQDVQNTQGFIDRQDLLQAASLIVMQILGVLQQQVAAALKHLLFLCRRFAIFILADLIDHLRDFPQALANNRLIFERCAFDLMDGRLHLPKVELSNGITAEKELARLAHLGLAKRYGMLKHDVVKRLEWRRFAEINLLNIAWAKENIPEVKCLNTTERELL